LGDAFVDNASTWGSDLNATRSKQENAFSDPFLVAIEGKGSTRDEINGSLSLIRIH
jgi:hypothetical protein